MQHQRVLALGGSSVRQYRFGGLVQIEPIVFFGGQGEQRFFQRLLN